MEEYLKRFRINLSDKNKLIQDTTRLEAQFSLILTQLKTRLIAGDCDSRWKKKNHQRILQSRLLVFLHHCMTVYNRPQNICPICSRITMTCSNLGWQHLPDWCFVLPVWSLLGLWSTGPVEQLSTSRCWFIFRLLRGRQSPWQQRQRWSSTEKILLK